MASNNPKPRKPSPKKKPPAKKKKPVAAKRKPTSRIKASTKRESKPQQSAVSPRRQSASASARKKNETSDTPVMETGMSDPTIDRRPHVADVSGREVKEVWAHVFRDTVAWIRGNWKRAVVAGVLGLVIGWLMNVAIMAYRFDGFAVPSGSPASGQGNVVRGALFWFAAAAVISAMIHYRIMAGRERFWSNVRSFPDTISNLVKADGENALMHVLTGYAGASLFVYILGPSMSAIVAVGLAVAIFSVLRAIIVATLMIAWRGVIQRLAPHSKQLPAQAMAVSVLGGIAAMAAGFIVRDPSIRFLLAVGAGVGAIVLARRQPSSSALGLLLVAGGALGAVMLGFETALADDGGWRECGSSVQNWLNCGGADRLRWLALFGGVSAGAGSAAGAGLVGAATEEWDPFEPMREFWIEEARHDRMQEYVEEWKELGGETGVSEEFQKWTEEREQYDWAKTVYESWRRLHPDDPPHNFFQSGLYHDALGGGSAVDVSMETIDAVILVVEGPGILKAGWDLTQWGFTKADEAVKYLAGRTDEILESLRASKETSKRLDEIVEAFSETDPQRLNVYRKLVEMGPEYVEAWLTILPDKDLKALASTVFRNIGDPTFEAFGEALHKAGLPLKWATQQANDIAKGALPPLFQKGQTIPTAELHNWAAKFLENNAPLLRNPPTADELVAKWQRALAAN